MHGVRWASAPAQDACLLTVLLLLTRSAVCVGLLAGTLRCTWVRALLPIPLLGVCARLPTWARRRSAVAAWLALLRRIPGLLRRRWIGGALRRGLRGWCPDLGVAGGPRGLSVTPCITHKHGVRCCVSQALPHEQAAGGFGANENNMRKDVRVVLCLHLLLGLLLMEAEGH